MKTILSISGGGMRGVVPCRILMEIERRLGSSVSGFFDLIAGTSTGGILACLVASPRDVTAREAMDFYFESGPRIFRRRWFDPGLLRPKYSEKDLHRELRSCLGEHTCGEARTKLLLPTVDADTIEATFIKSWQSEWSSFPMWSAAASTSSAQTYFPALRRVIGKEQKRFLDGGNHTNNPAASALFEGFRLWPGEDLLVVHLGTGKQANPRPLPDGGIVQWAPLIFDTTSECQDDCATYFCRNALGPHFLSFDILIDRFQAMDDSSSKVLQGLVNTTKAMLARRSSEIDTLCSLLSDSASPSRPSHSYES